MEEYLKNSFKKSKHEPSLDLADGIWNTIVLRNKRIAYLKLAFFSSISIASFVGLVPTFKMLLADFTQSGFYEYLSIAFSKNGFLSSYWKELAYSLAESLPTISLALSLSLIFVFFLSLRYVMKQIIKGQTLILQARPV